MLSKKISESVLTIGNEYNPPKGGMAQVVYTYANDAFCPFRFVSCYNGGSSLSKIIVFLKGLIRFILLLCLDKRIQIVHIHTGSGTSFFRSSFFIRFAKILRRKVVLHMHGGGFKEFYQANAKFVGRELNRADMIVALTPSWEGFYRSIGCNKICVIDNIIDYPHVNVSIDSSKVHFLFLGLICNEKGIFDLLDVFAENKSKLQNRVVLHVGGNGEIDRIRKCISDLDLSDIIKFEGWVYGDTKVDLFNRCDCFILPSYIEGMPISVLEALSYGLFILSTNVGGLPEIINDTNGYMFNPGDKTAILTCILDVVNNIASIRAKRSLIASTVDNHLPDAVCTRLENLYTGLL